MLSFLFCCRPIFFRSYLCLFIVIIIIIITVQGMVVQVRESCSKQCSQIGIGSVVDHLLIYYYDYCFVFLFPFELCEVCFTSLRKHDTSLSLCLICVHIYVRFLRIFLPSCFLHFAPFLLHFATLSSSTLHPFLLYLHLFLPPIRPPSSSILPPSSILSPFSPFLPPFLPPSPPPPFFVHFPFLPP